MPTNLYGPGDNYNLETSHVLPALIRKFHEAKVNGDKEVTLWGTGEPLREFLHSDDLAEATLFCLKNYGGGQPLNVGSGEEISIKELATHTSSAVGFSGKVIWDTSEPSGTPRKKLDSSILNELGFRVGNTLHDSLPLIYADFKMHLGKS